MTDADLIKHLWTHKTQDHPSWCDEDLMIERGQGVYVWNRKGRRLFDAYAGLAVVNVGHGRAEIADAVREQVAKLAYYPTTRQFSNPPAARLAARLAELTPGDLKYTLFAVSGSEANERSMQIARVYWLKVGRPRKYKVISLTYGYHGATLATLAICGQPDMVRAYEPLAWEGFRKVAAPYPMWDRGAGTDEDLVRRCADRLAEVIREEDPETVAAVILEPCLSSGGCIIPPLGWLERVRDVCDEFDVLMIADEVITGFGRTGKWFGVNHESVVPDLMSVAKGITSGYVPLSASIAREKLADAFPEDSREENVHPNTYCGHPVACAAALANIAIIERENLVRNSEAMGARLHAEIESRVRDYPIVGEVRSRGLMVALDFADPERRDRPLDRNLVARLNTRALDKGYIAMAKDSVFRLAPPLCISTSEVEELAQLVGETVRELQDEVTRSTRSQSPTANRPGVAPMRWARPILNISAACTRCTASRVDEAWSNTMPKVIPVPDELSKPFWDAVNAKRLVLQHCDGCNKLQYPPQKTCQVCGSAAKLVWKEVSGKGHIATYIVIEDGRLNRRMPDQPYNLAMVTLDEDPTINFYSNLPGTPPYEVPVGAPVEVTFEEVAPGQLIHEWRVK